MPVSATGKSAEEPRARGRPKAEDVAALEARLIQVAAGLFFRNGYGATSMNAVAAEARVSKTTLWARFPTKADLFRAIVREQTERWGSGVNRARTPRFDTLDETLFGYGDVILYAGTLPEFVHFTRLLFSESERFPELGEVATARFDLARNHLAKHVRAFAERDNIPCRDADAAADLFVMMLIGWSNARTLSNRIPSTEERREWLGNAVRTFMLSRSGW